MPSLQKLLQLLRTQEQLNQGKVFHECSATFISQLQKAKLPLPEPHWQETDWLRLTLAIEHWLGQSPADHDLGIQTKDQHDRPISLMPVTLVADHIRSAMNVGSMVRSLEFFGGEAFLAIGYTPALDHPLVQKTALGTERCFQAERQPTLSDALATFKTRLIRTVAFETCERATSFSSWSPSFPLALIFGHERQGISANELQKCDEIVAIPGFGRKNSLNVAVTTGIVLQKVRQVWQDSHA